MSKVIVPILRFWQTIVAAVTLALSAYVARWYNSETIMSSPTPINYLIFVPIWTFFSIAYLELSTRKFARASHPYAHLVIEMVTTIFYFAGFVSLSVFLSQLLFCRGSICSAARGDAAFAAFGFLTWMTSTVLTGMTIFKGGVRRRNAGLPSGTDKEWRVNGPQMSGANEKSADV